MKKSYSVLGVVNSDGLCGAKGRTDRLNHRPPRRRYSGDTAGVVEEHPDAARVITLYDRHAGTWSCDRGDRLVERTWLDRFLVFLPDQRRAILDVGCGTAVPIAQYLIKQGCQLHGVDSSSAMITLSTTRFPDHQWDVADMRALAVDRQFSGIIAWDSLFHLSPPDQRRMFPIFARHAAPGAVLLFNSGGSAGEQIGSYQGEPLYHASLDPSEYQSLLGDNGFDVIAHVVTDPTCGQRTIWLAQTA
ncbi:methyltransferase domain-containing protein [Mycobacterium sp. 050128]|uniref:class I SAM-dependent DNA methyltransferase n=1 Tax=Mycobacterium sp. 050128 TaxID=3096112 RepID=UPI002EDAEC52